MAAASAVLSAQSGPGGSLLPPAPAAKALPGNPAALAGAQRPLRVPSSICCAPAVRELCLGVEHPVFVLPGCLRRRLGGSGDDVCDIQELLLGKERDL